MKLEKSAIIKEVTESFRTLIESATVLKVTIAERQIEINKLKEENKEARGVIRGLMEDWKSDYGRVAYLNAEEFLDKGEI